MNIVITGWALIIAGAVWLVIDWNTHGGYEAANQMGSTWKVYSSDLNIYVPMCIAGFGLLYLSAKLSSAHNIYRYMKHAAEKKMEQQSRKSRHASANCAHTLIRWMQPGRRPF